MQSIKLPEFFKTFLFALSKKMWDIPVELNPAINEEVPFP